MSRKPPLYPHIPKNQQPNEDVKKELRFHRLLCDQSYDHLTKVKDNMWRIEVERAKRYSRTDPIAIKANEVMWGVRKQIDKLTEICDRLEEQEGENA